MGLTREQRIANLGKFARKGNPSPMKGKKLRPETIDKLKKYFTENPSHPFEKGNDLWKKRKHWAYGPNAEAIKQKMRGQNNRNWKGGVYSTNNKLRRSPEYKRWQIAVYKKDNYICQLCKIEGKKLNANHIKKFSDFPELRFDINNGITLCIDCHKSITGKEKYMEETFLKIIGGGN